MDYRNCAVDCVGEDTLHQYKSQFEACDFDRDVLFSVPTGDDDLGRRVIEPGHIYETGYSRCICWRPSCESAHCECSRQALIFLYSQLLPDKHISVETVCTVNQGAPNCTFRIVVE